VSNIYVLSLISLSVFSFLSCIDPGRRPLVQQRATSQSIAQDGSQGRASVRHSQSVAPQFLGQATTSAGRWARLRFPWPSRVELSPRPFCPPATVVRLARCRCPKSRRGVRYAWRMALNRCGLQVHLSDVRRWPSDLEGKRSLNQMGLCFVTTAVFPYCGASFIWNRNKSAVSLFVSAASISAQSPLTCHGESPAQRCALK
jgi:hypothetical protein